MAAHGTRRTQVGATRQAVLAPTAEHGQAGNDVVARFELIDLRADGLDDPRGLVPEDGGRGKLIETVDMVQIAVAHPTGDDAYDDFVIDGRVDVDLLNGERLMRAMKNGRLHATTSSRRVRCRHGKSGR